MVDKKYIKATKSWLKTQDLSIESCDINIAFYKKQIINLQKSIKAEQEEKRNKIGLKKDVLKKLGKYVADNIKVKVT